MVDINTICHLQSTRRYYGAVVRYNFKGLDASIYVCYLVDLPWRPPTLAGPEDVNLAATLFHGALYTGKGS